MNFSRGYPDAAERYERFLSFVWEDKSKLRELPESELPSSIPELELQARWFAGELGRNFSDTEGRPVEIVQFGHWNHSAGPDFTEAAVRVGGDLLRGAVEVDLEASNWESHGHGINPDFDQVVLHVFPAGTNPGAPRFHTRNSSHHSVTQVKLDPLAAFSRRSAWRYPPEARRGRCATPLREMSDTDLESLLHSAAQFRLQGKARRFGAIASAHSESEALYQTVAEALGYRQNKLVMAILAQRLPLAELKSYRPIEREALLFGVAGFLDHEHFREASDSDARNYLKALWDHWWKKRSELEPAPERQLVWKLSGNRPTNHPQRRVAALTVLVNQWSRFRQLVENKEDPGIWVNRLRDFLRKLPHDYWRHHYTLKARPSEKELALIGKDRIGDILGNVLFPAAIGSFPPLWESYLNLPGTMASESLRRACLRLFGDGDRERERAGDWSRRYWQQQALLQIYADFCLEDASECAECLFPDQLRQWSGSD